MDNQFGSTKKQSLSDFRENRGWQGSAARQAQLMYNCDECGRTSQTLAHCYAGCCCKSGVATNRTNTTATEHQGLLKD